MVPAELPTAALPPAGPPPAPVVETFAPLARLARAAPCRRALTSGPRRLEIAEMLHRALAESGARVLSLDVFDTLLLRDGVPEAERFHALSAAALADLRAAGIHGAAALSVEDLLVARAEAMALSYRLRPAREGCREGTLVTVAAVMCAQLGLPPDAAERLIDSEIAVETGALAVNAAFKDAIARHRAGGGTVIAISDMYLSGAQIGAIIAARDPELARMISTIYSSADTVLSKRSGRIFAAIAAERGLPADAFLHVGDSLPGDVRRPREAGWAALHFPVSMAEEEARRDRLVRFIARMGALGFDVRAWAKT